MSHEEIFARGTILNLLAAGVTYGLVLALAPAGPATRYFAWLFLSINLLQATGYWMFSGIGNIGDWAVVIRGWEPHWAYRIGLALVGVAGYMISVRISLHELSKLLGRAEDRVARARVLTLVPYLAGGLLYVTAGLLNPEGLILVLISAAAASFGGTSAMAWMFNLLRGRAFPAPDTPPLPLPLPRSAGWIAAGVVAAVLFIAVLGPGIRF